MYQAILYFLLLLRQSKDIGDLKQMLHEIASRHFHETEVSIFFQNDQKGKAGSLAYLVQEVIKYFATAQKWTIQLYTRTMISSVAYSKVKIVKSEIIILMFDEEDDANKIANLMSIYRDNYSWNSRAKMLILTNGNEKRAKVILQTVWETAKVSNAAVYFNNENKIYNWVPYQPYECDQITNISSKNVVDLYHAKSYRNLYGCSLDIISQHMPPYVIIERTFENRIYEGIEVKLLNALVKVQNVKLEYKEIDNTTNIWLMKHPNGTLAGAIGDLSRYQADMAYSCLMLTYDRFVWSDALFPFAQSEIVWIVPTPRRISAMTHLLSIFDVKTWFLVFLMLALLLITLYLKEGRKSSITLLILQSFSSFLNMPVKSSSRYLTTLSYISAMHILTAYQSSLLVNLMKEPTEKPYETFEEVVEEGLKAHLLPSLMPYYSPKESPSWAKILRKGHYTLLPFIHDTLVDVAEKKTAILMYPKLPALYEIQRKQLDKNGIPKVNILKNRFMSSLLTFYMAPGHPLTPIFTKRISEIVESGLFLHWTEEYVDKILFHRFVALSQESTAPLSLKNLAGVFVIWLACIMVCLVVFIVEVIFDHISKKKRKII